jgi:antitoxin CptB
MAEIDRVRWHCRRGLLELDLVLTRFLDRHWAQLTDPEKQTFARLLEFQDNDLWDLLTGRVPAPDQESKKLIDLLS